jgi:glycosyltransferase involved in cell wall biosynthesis
MTDSFRVIAIIAAFNEEDIISSVIQHLIDNGIDVYLIDNHSTDDTVQEASQWLGRGLVHIERFPQPLSPGYESLGVFDWSGILRRKEELATELSADWLIHHDADEFRESPWPGLTLKAAIRWVDKLGYNCINFQVLNFCPIDDNFQRGDDPRNYFTFFENGAEFDRVQLKCWKVSKTQASLVPSGGHEVSFEGRRVFPISFLLRHYPIRGQRHGLKKVFAERKKRFLESERSKGWHIQYDQIKEENHYFLRDPATLRPFNLERARLELMMPEKVLRDLADRLVRTEGELDTFRSKKEEQQQALAEKEEHAKRIAEDRDRLTRDVAELQSALSSQQQALAEKEEHAKRIAEDRDRLTRDVAELQSALNSQQQALAKKEEHAKRIAEDRERLTQDVAELQSALSSQQAASQCQLDQLSLDQERLGLKVLNLQATVRGQQQELAEKDLQIVDLVTQQDHSNHQLISMDIRCQERERELTELGSDQKRLLQDVAVLQATVQHQRIALDTLHGTFGSLLTNRLRPVKNKVLLPGTRRRRLYDIVLAALKDRLRNGYSSSNGTHSVQFEPLVIWESANKPALAQRTTQNGTHNGRMVRKAVPVQRFGGQHFAIYTSSLGNYFFSEFRDLLAAGFQSLGFQVDIRDEGEGFSEVADWHLVVAPHEFFYLGAGRELSNQSLPSNLVLFNTEQPSTQWYARARDYFSKACRIWDINNTSSQEIARTGFNCEYLPLGYLPDFKLFREVEELPNHYGTLFLGEKICKSTYLRKPFVERPIDVLFLGTLSARREKFFALASRALSNHSCYLYLPSAEGPLLAGLNTTMDTTTSVGLAQRAKIILNIHRGADRYFEWHRIVMHGIWNRALVITEPCGEGPPFQPGVHFVEAPLSQIADVVEYYLADPKGQAEAQAIALKGFQMLSEQCKLTDSLRPLLLRSCSVSLPNWSQNLSHESASSA